MNRPEKFFWRPYMKKAKNTKCGYSDYRWWGGGGSPGLFLCFLPEERAHLVRIARSYSMHTMRSTYQSMNNLRRDSLRDRDLPSESTDNLRYVMSVTVGGLLFNFRSINKFRFPFRFIHSLRNDVILSEIDRVFNIRPMIYQRIGATKYNLKHLTNRIAFLLIISGFYHLSERSFK